MAFLVPLHLRLTYTVVSTGSKCLSGYLSDAYDPDVMRYREVVLRVGYRSPKKVSRNGNSIRAGHLFMA
jgi:hypothetical protein